jgi:hypothetical protein
MERGSGWQYCTEEPPKECPYFLEQMLYSMSLEEEVKQGAK